jgi:antitoxin component YwqK of YwqJK toxin-antitoxin module
MKQELNQKDSEGKMPGVWKFRWGNGGLIWRGHYHHGNPYGLQEIYNRRGKIEAKNYHLNIK